MSPEEKKASWERGIFIEYVTRFSLPIKLSSIVSRPSPEPDILCEYNDGHFEAWELCEVCDENIAKEISYLSNKTDDTASFLHTSDPSSKILAKKLKKLYQCDVDINLLLYTNGRVVTPRDVLVYTLQDALARTNQNIYFKTIILMTKNLDVLFENQAPVFSSY